MSGRVCTARLASGGPPRKAANGRARSWPMERENQRPAKSWLAGWLAGWLTGCRGLRADARRYDESTSLDRGSAIARRSLLFALRAGARPPPARARTRQSHADPKTRRARKHARTHADAEKPPSNRKQKKNEQNTALAYAYDPNERSTKRAPSEPPNEREKRARYPPRANTTRSFPHASSHTSVRRSGVSSSKIRSTARACPSPTSSATSAPSASTPSARSARAMWW